MKDFEHEPVKGANDNDNRHKETLDNPEFQKFSKLADHLHEIKDDETLQLETQKFAEYIGEKLTDHKSYMGKAFRAVRKGWDKIPNFFQQAILKGEETLPFAPGICNDLIEAGIIKHPKHTSPQALDQHLKEKAEWDAKKTKWGVYIAGIFAPEVEAIVPFLEPIQKLKASKAKVLEIVRHHLDTLKIELETEGKEHKVMDKTSEAEAA